MWTLGSHPRHTEEESVHWEFSGDLYLQFPLRSPALAKVTRTLQLDKAVSFTEHSEYTVYAHLSLPLDCGLLEGKDLSLLPLYFQSLSLSLAHGAAQQMSVYLNWTDLRISLELKSWIPDAVSFYTDWMLSLLAELMLFLPPLSKFTDGLEHLLTQSGLLPDVDCCGPGSWTSLFVTSQALMTEASFRDCIFVSPSRRSLIWVQGCVCVVGGGASWLSGYCLSSDTCWLLKLLIPFSMQNSSAWNLHDLTPKQLCSRFPSSLFCTIRLQTA